MFSYEETFFEEQKVAVSAEKAWEIIALPGGLSRWHPFMKMHTAERWDGVGSTDHLTYYSGYKYDREVTQWIDGVGYDLKATENGKRECTAIWRITPLDETHCILRITGAAPFIKKLPFPIRWALLQFKMKPVFSDYLRRILKGFAWHAETGKPIQKNQFGPHPIFSPEGSVKSLTTSNENRKSGENGIIVTTY